MRLGMMYPTEKKIAAFKKIVKMPSVMILSGSVKKRRIGRTKALRRPRTRAPSQEAVQSANHTPGKSHAVTTSARTLENQRIKNAFMKTGPLACLREGGA